MGDPGVGRLLRARTLTANAVPATDLLRQSFSGINGRFHLVGLYTLLDLLMRIVFAEANVHPEEWGFLLLPIALTALAASFGILGLVIHAAAGRGSRPPFLQVVALLFLPLVWLQVKITVLTYGPAIVGLLSWHAMSAAGQPLETWAPAAAWWVEPFVEAATVLLTVYATPYAVRHRVRGTRGAPVREGVRLLASKALGGPILLLVLVPAIALGTTAHFLRPASEQSPVPGVAGGLSLLVMSYLTLVAVFGAARLIARRPAENKDAGAEFPAEDGRPPGAAPGPTA